MEYNELNKNAMGGTELVAHRIESMLEPELLEQVQIIHSRARELDDTKKKIYVLHDLAGDPEVQHLRDGGWEKYDKLVFVSHWQRQMYEAYLGVPPSASVVMRNSIVPIPHHEKPKDKIRLFYHSTPHRGLQILFPVFKQLHKEYGDRIDLKVFSSFGLYGWPSRDEPYLDLFEEMKEHPAVDYNQAVSNDVIREELTKAHIFAYPSIWQETSCLCLIEAMSAELTTVHSSLGALPETSMGLSLMYDYTEDVNKHANIFYQNMKNAIENIDNPTIQRLNSIQKLTSDAIHSVDRLKVEWNSLVKGIVM